MDVITDTEVIRANISEAWQIEGDAILKVVPQRNFAEGLALVNLVGEIAEALDHHPDVELRYSSVTFRLSTHWLGGITENDFALARRIDALEDEAR